MVSEREREREREGEKYLRQYTSINACSPIDYFLFCIVFAATVGFIDRIVFAATVGFIDR